MAKRDGKKQRNNNNNNGNRTKNDLNKMNVEASSEISSDSKDRKTNRNK
ncbi:hypothetical protein KYB31_18345 [Clostridium felsineum]|nr:hypothetical protein [Clostridium felsineum]MCR3760937.1 hypothetical protein [Clostridium felsineum]